MKLSEQYGELGKALEIHIDETLKQIVSKLLEPVTPLHKFEEVDVLTLEEVCKVLRCDSKEKMRDACKRGDVPYVQLGRDYLFPKSLFVEYLLGKWNQPEIKKQLRTVESRDLDERINKFLAD